MRLPGAPTLRDKLPKTVQSAARQVYRGLWSRVAPLLSDRQYFTSRYDMQCGRLPRFCDPRTFNEKVVWRILCDRRPLLRTASDEVVVRDFISARVGPEWLVETYGAYGALEDAPWASFPPMHVVKASHGGGWWALIDGGSPAGVVPAMQHWLDTDYYDKSREPVCHGFPRLIQAVHGRLAGVVVRYYAADWRVMPLFTSGLGSIHASRAGPDSRLAGAPAPSRDQRRRREWASSRCAPHASMRLLDHEHEHDLCGRDSSGKHTIGMTWGLNGDGVIVHRA